MRLKNLLNEDGNVSLKSKKIIFAKAAEVRKKINEQDTYKQQNVRFLKEICIHCSDAACNVTSEKDGSYVMKFLAKGDRDIVRKIMTQNFVGYKKKIWKCYNFYYISVK